MFIDRSDIELIALAKGQLDWSPNKNWVEKAGGLPTDIEDLAVELVKKGMTRERAIATAVSRAKYFATTSKNAKTRAKWSKAVAEWEKLKAKSHAKSAVKMSVEQESAHDILMMSSGSFNMDKVIKAFDEEQRAFAIDFASRNPQVKPEYIPTLTMYELWNDSVIAEDQAGHCYRAPYVVTSNGDVIFGKPEEVIKQYVPVDEAMMQDAQNATETVDAEDMTSMMDTTSGTDTTGTAAYSKVTVSNFAETPLLAKVLGLSRESALEKILKL